MTGGTCVMNMNCPQDRGGYAQGLLYMGIEYVLSKDTGQ